MDKQTPSPHQVFSSSAGFVSKLFLLGLLLALATIWACTLPTGVVIVTSTPPPSPTATMTPTLTASPTVTPIPTISCPNAPAPRLEVGDHARVTEGEPNRLRRKPVVDPKNIIQLLHPGTEFDVIGGPVCAPIPDIPDFYIFWEIRIPGDPTTGWIAEGNMANYFVEPLP